MDVQDAVPESSAPLPPPDEPTDETDLFAGWPPTEQELQIAQRLTEMAGRLDDRLIDHLELHFRLPRVHPNGGPQFRVDRKPHNIPSQFVARFLADVRDPRFAKRFESLVKAASLALDQWYRPTNIADPPEQPRCPCCGTLIRRRD